MNENIDLTKILKDCPKEMEFWSDDYGKVKFLGIDIKRKYPIMVIRTDGYVAFYTKEGWCSIDFPASCLLWPSKDCRDWSKFTAPWYKKEKFNPKTLQPFNKVLVNDDSVTMWKVDFYSHKDESKAYPYRCIGNSYTYCIPYNDETKQLVGTTDEAPEYYRYWEE